MGALTIDRSEVKAKPTHWATYTTTEGGALFNGTQDECAATLVQFVRDFGKLAGFECGMGARQEMN
jgi:hypothetical protein